MATQSLYSCGFRVSAPFDSAWLSEVDFRRLLPVCCPDWQTNATAEVHFCARDPELRTPARNALSIDVR